jgi:cytokinin dehydrogenase
MQKNTKGQAPAASSRNKQLEYIIRTDGICDPQQYYVQEVETMLAPLNYIPSLIFTADVSYFQFLNRVHDVELSLSSQGLWETLSHPWINLLVPGSAISDFDEQVFQQLICQDFSGPILVYPLNKHK